MGHYTWVCVYCGEESRDGQLWWYGKLHQVFTGGAPPDTEDFKHCTWECCPDCAKTYLPERFLEAY